MPRSASKAASGRLTATGPVPDPRPGPTLRPSPQERQSHASGQPVVISIAEMLPAGSGPDALWRLMRQAGVRHAVGSLPGHIHVFPGERPWDLAPLMRLREQYHSYGFHLDVIESRPPHNLVKRGLAGRDAEIDAICALLENMGKLGIRVWCYEWMTDFNWLRTDLSGPVARRLVGHQLRPRAHAAAPPSDLGPIGEDALWAEPRVLPPARGAGGRAGRRQARDAS